MKYAFIRNNLADHGVQILCRVLEVSASGYYAWCDRPHSQRAQTDKRLLLEIQRIHAESRQNYGSLKTWKALNSQGIVCGKHKVARLRRLHGIESKRRRRFKVTTHSKNNEWIVPNHLNRRFQTSQPNQVWVGDVTFIATRAGWLYLAIMLDLYSRKIVGWSMSNQNNTDLVLNALDMAWVRRKPDAEVLHHTDRGAVYAADEYRARLSAYHLKPSMSRKADCYDNAVAESFFSTLKSELTSGNLFPSREMAKTEIFEYIEIFYNRQRLHQSLNYLTPEKAEMEFVP